MKGRGLVSHEVFYSTAATVIPVLFLAMTLQNPALSRTEDEDRQQREEMVRQKGLDEVYQRGVAIEVAFPWTLVVLLIAFGVGGEVLAVVALATTHDDIVVRWLVAVATIALTLWVAYRYIRTLRRRAMASQEWYRNRWPRSPEERPPTEQR
jgi:hypothetical protein